MTQTRLAVTVGALLALHLPVFAISLSPFDWFGGETATALGRRHDPSHDVTSNGVTKTQMQYLYKEDYIVTDVDLSQGGGSSVDTGTVSRIVHDAVSVTSASAYAGAAPDSLAGRILNTNVVLSVSGGRLSILDGPETVWTSGSSLTEMTNVTGRAEGGCTVFDVIQDTVAFVRADPDPAQNVVMVSFADEGRHAASCHVLVRSTGAGHLSVRGSQALSFIGSTSFVLDAGYHFLTVTRLARDGSAGSYLTYAEIHRLD